MKKIKVIFVFFILSAIIVPIMFFNHEKNVASSLDNRMLTELENYSLENVENYISDRIGFRENMILFYNKINRELFDVITSGDLMLGSDKENLYPKISSTTKFDGYHQKFLDSVKEIQNYLEDRGIGFYFIFEPSKSSIMKDNLPEGLNYSNEWIDDFVYKAKEMNINIVDNYTYFNLIKDEESLYNISYDTYHWNDNGAFLGVNNLLEKISNDYFNVQINDIDEYDLIIKEKDEDGKDIDDYVVEYIPKNKAINLSNKYYSGLEMHKDFNDFYYFKANNNAPSVLSFQGSYLMTSDRTEKFLANNFSKTVAIHNYQNIFNINYYLNIFRPDIVIFEVADYTFAEYYFAQYYMETMFLPLTLDKFNEYKKNDKCKDLNYIKDINGEYVTYIFDNVANKYEYAYLLIDDKMYDLRKYDNENMALTILKEDDFDVNDVKVIYVDEEDNSINIYVLNSNYS